MVHGRKKMFASLARGLAPDHPLGFLFGHWETGDVDPDLDVGRTADQALDRLRAFQPAGPYRIGGYSFGSVIAFEMAQRLAAVGETVELLFLLDPPFRLPGHGGPAQLARSDRPIAHGDWYGATAPSADDVLATTFVEKLAKHARVIRGTGPAALPGYLAERARRIGQLYVVDPARFRLTAAIRRLTGRVPQHLRFAYVTRAYHQAFLRYRPRPWSGRTLVVATHDAGTIPERAEWTAALPGADVEMLDVGHVALQLDADALDRWMVVLSAALNREAHR
jgi:thioesterase domain-containing protein